MKLAIALLAIAIYVPGGSALHAGTDDQHDKPPIQAILYTSGATASVELPVPVVVEIENLGSGTAKINNYFRVVSGPRSENSPITTGVHEVEKETRELFPAKDEGLYITFEILVPPDSVLQAHQSDGPFTPRITEVPAGGDTLLKFVLSRGSLATGKCQIRALVRSGPDVVTVSETIGIEGLARMPATAATQLTVFDPTRGHRIAVTEKWIAWTRFAEAPDPRSVFKRGSPVYQVRYFVQRLDANLSATQVLEQPQSIGRPESATVLDDGTLLRDAGTTLQWAPARPVKKGEPTYLKEEIGTFALFAEGVISLSKNAHIWNGVSVVDPFESVWWTPIRDHGLDIASKLLLEEGVSGGLHFVRHGNEIAWLDATLVPKLTKGDDRPATLSIFDVSKKTVQTVTPTGINIGPNSITGFDGSVVLTGDTVIDARTGQTTRGPSPTGLTIGLLRHTEYWLTDTPQAYELVATPLDDAKAARVVARIEKKTIGPVVDGKVSRVDPTDLFFLTADGVRAWNGQTWAKVDVGKF